MVAVTTAPHAKLIQSVQIGISVYRQPLAWLQQCIHSALTQTGPVTITVTVRCDGPDACDPDCLHWLRQINEDEPRLLLIEGTEQCGTFGSYHQIFETSNSTFLCQLDADDWLEPDAIAQAIADLEGKSEAPFLYTQYQEVSGEGKPLRLGTRSLTPFNKQRMLVQFITYHLRVIRRAAYHECGGYDPSLQFCGDYNLSLRLCELGTPIHLAKPLYNYRLHGDNTSTHQRQATIQEAFVVAQQALNRRRQNHRLELILDAEACRVTLQPRKGPVVIAGMHRSGTSLLALMLQSLGLELGHDLLPADQHNPDGYGEDQPVVNLQRQALQRSCQGQSGWPDWGWQERPESEQISPADAQWRLQAKHYLTHRNETNTAWGWKDPRSTLFLEEWLELEPGLKLIAVYRDPWEIVDALQRITPPVFATRPDWPLPIWIHYNQKLARFARRHPERCLLLHSSVITNRPEHLLDALTTHWQWPLHAPRTALVQALHQMIRQERLAPSPLHAPLAQLHQACSSEAALILRELDSLATLPPERPTAMGGTALTLMQTPIQPRLAVVITSHNQGDLLLEAIASAEHACKQQPVELLIVDDGSSHPRTLEVLQRLNGLGYRILRQTNQGLPAARNTGLAATTAEIVLFLDDDNRLLPGYLTPGLSLMLQQPHMDALYGNRIDFGSTRNMRRIGAIDPNELWTMNRIDNCTLLRRQFLERCSGYDTSLPAFEDWDLWLTALGQPDGLTLGYLDLPCFEYRIRPDSMLQRLFREPQRQQALIRALRKKHGSRVGHGGLKAAASY